MVQLLGPNGRPIDMTKYSNKKEAPPKLGEAFAPWAGRDVEFMRLPGGGVVQFDLSQLRLEDFRNMRDHYQVNASLSVLNFLQHQTDWHIEHPDKKIAQANEEMLRSIWTPLNRSLGTANWAGYSPNALDWDNNIEKKSIDITKVKDLIPEECEVNWKEIEGWAPPGRVRPKYKIYDGIKYEPQRGWPIPVENSFWYPLLMENGDYYGRKLLRPAFQSWFFSILIHLFANRYFERFGDTTPIGRAPFDEELDVPGPNGQSQKVRGNEYLLNVLQQIRSRAAVVLPNDRSQVGGVNNSTTEFDYEIEYLESQMRGADFERYLTRLDEEISLGLFTPILLLRTADVGSYNLGVGHLQVYHWMMNAMNDDRAQYIQKYILRKFTNYNFSPKAPTPKMVYRKLGNTDTDLLKQVLVELIKGGKAGINVEELGKLVGMSLKEIRQTTTPAKEPGDDDGKDEPDASVTDNTGKLVEARGILREIASRVEPQVVNAFKDHRFAEARFNLGYKRRFATALETEGVLSYDMLTDLFYGRMDNWLRNVVALGEDEFSGPESFMHLFNRALEVEFDRIEQAA